MGGRSPVYRKFETSTYDAQAGYTVIIPNRPRKNQAYVLVRQKTTVSTNSMQGKPSPDYSGV